MARGNLTDLMVTLKQIGIDPSELINKIEENKMSEEQPKKLEEVNITHEGRKIILPSEPTPMTEEAAIEHLHRKAQQNNQCIGIHEEVNAFPLEGAYALMQVLQQTFGWFNAQSRKVGAGPWAQTVPPEVINLEVGPGKYEQVIWGEFSVPGVDGRFTTSATRADDGRLIFCISGETYRKHEKLMKTIAQKVRDYLKENSIYKGKAIILATEKNGDLNFRRPPSFLDLSKVNENELIFPKHLQEQVEMNLFVPIEHTAECRKNGVPLKRGVLLEGPYGTGKTLTAYVTAKKAQDNGWTFIYLDRVAALRETISFARYFAPCVIFAEDIDRVVQGDRTVKVDDILNNIDGIDSKNTEVITVLSTNHVEDISKAMLRPGRLDAVVSFEPPDAEAAGRLIRTYARGLVPEGEDLTEACKELAGQIPATIREVVERSKLYSIGQHKGGTFMLTGKAIAAAARGMKKHIELLNGKKSGEQTPEEQLGHAMVKVVKEGFNGNSEKIEQIHHRLCE